jgi:hypothetical protein
VGKGIRTRNSKLEAEGVIMVTSWAVEALCMAFGPMEANETLPTRTFQATVRDWKDVCDNDRGREVAFLTMAHKT